MIFQTVKPEEDDTRRKEITLLLAADNFDDESQMDMALHGELAGKIVEQIFERASKRSRHAPRQSYAPSGALFHVGTDFSLLHLENRLRLAQSLSPSHAGMIPDDRLTSQVQSNDRLKSVLGPGLQRNHTAKEKMALYQQGFDEKGVITIFNLNSLNALERIPPAREELSNDLEFMQFLYIVLSSYLVSLFVTFM